MFETSIQNELDALILLNSIPLIGSIKIRLLIGRFGSALKALDAPLSQVAELPGFGSKVMDEWTKWHKNKSWRMDRDLAYDLGVEIIPFTDKRYPKKLLEIQDFPILIYLKGEIKVLENRSIAVVGTRQVSIYGKEMAEKISSDLASSGFTVASGLARGVDTAAHIGALQKGKTIAVIGSGLANIYPQENKELALHITKNGALLSEFPMSTPPDRQNFPQRNRIVSGLSLATLLIEAPMKSGAMITMGKAHSQNRRLFAIPGRSDLDNFRGNHHLIKNGFAQLVEDASDIINCFEDLLSSVNIKKEVEEKNGLLEKEELKFLSQLPHNELSIDEIIQITSEPANRVNVLLMSLVLKKAIKEFPGKFYKKL